MAQNDWVRIFREKIQGLGLSDSWWIEFDNNINIAQPGWENYIRNTFARFHCSQCRHTWASAQVPVMFHMKLDASQGSGIVKVRCCKQECKKCPTPILEQPQISSDNITVLMDKLMLKIRKKCYKENVEENATGFIIAGKLDGPHESRHCEGCQLGICSRRGDSNS
ncbi:RTP3 protein, partial [Polyodon spathula]|nr:receptor-transporting protein 3-like [Polyodon spathula]MBN3277843.1 RTP3 protein [Polyodon spathula]